MEKNEKIVKVYSNNSKKSRLKRNKNKFQRVWDAEKQTYVKVRKAKYPAAVQTKRTDWRKKDNSVALKRLHETPKEKKSAPVIAKMQKPETNQTVRKEPARIHAKITKATSIRIGGIIHTWDSQTLKYKRAA